jgi:hypothetical protein
VLVDIIIGLLLGLLSWWIVGRAVTPRIWISPDVSKLPDETENATFRYRVKVFNLRRVPLPRRPAIDVRIDAYLSIRGMDSTRPKDWYRMNIPVGNTGDLAYFMRNSVFRLRVHDIEERQAARLPEQSRADIAAGAIQLEDLLRLGSKSRLRVVVTAAHIYTFGRNVAVADFHLADIICGRFDAEKGRRVSEAPELCANLERRARARLASDAEIDEGH